MSKLPNATIAALITAALIVGYITIARYHYNQGYAAHEAMVEAEIRKTNQEIAHLKAQLSREMLLSAAETKRQVEAVEAAMRSYCAQHPDKCGAEVKAKPGSWRTDVIKECSVPHGVLAALNTIR